MALLSCEALTFSYPKSEKKALDAVSFSVSQGEFLLLAGQSGCGKSTLLKLLKDELAPAGTLSGKIRYDGAPLGELSPERSATEIGFVMQEPDAQIVTDEVYHELAFGLENLGLPSDVIRRRVAETASYFGISALFRRKTDELSGGEKQLVNLAAVTVMRPRVLLLDEPTGQLDPIAADSFLTSLVKLNRELGITVILAEHRLEEVFPLADRVLMLDHGKLLFCEKPEDVNRNLPDDHPMTLALPTPVKIFHALSKSDNCPLTVKEGRDFLAASYQPEKASQANPTEEKTTDAIAWRDLFFRYQKDGRDILRASSFSVKKGKITCIVGGNGAGKTTLLHLLAGLLTPYRGKISVFGKPIASYKGQTLYRENLAFLPQDPTTLFIGESVREDLAELPRSRGLSEEAIEAEIREVAEKFGIDSLLDRHPYDLSGGEKQKCALAKVMLSHPKILLLDEPTKGLDAFYKEDLKKLLRAERDNGLTVLSVTHDLDFAASLADTCALFFDGDVISADRTKRFFSQNHVYTTAASRMARDIFPDAVTEEDVIEACLGQKREAK